MTGRKAPNRLRAFLLLGGGLATLLGCGSSDSSEHRVINEKAGEYRGVAFGQTRAEVIKRLGDPAKQSDPITPVGADPNNVDQAPAWNCHGPGLTKQDLVAAKLGTMRYEQVSVIVSNDRVCDLIIVERGASTLRNIAVGDSLEEAKRVYSGLNCGIANEGTDYPTYPFCTGKVAPRRYIWFGGDPINTIQLNTQEFGKL